MAALLICITQQWYTPIKWRKNTVKLVQAAVYGFEKKNWIELRTDGGRVRDGIQFENREIGQWTRPIGQSNY